jgi:outer membrane protein OmpA-like peptidoglycan-associated protein
MRKIVPALAAVTAAAGFASLASAQDAGTPPSQAECKVGPYIVFFDSAQSDITPAAATILDSAIAAYAGCNGAPISLTGHTDRTGNDRANMELSARRNDSVKAYLTGHGLVGGAIASRALGETMPRVPTADGIKEAQNRRVEITFGGASGS